MKIFFLLVLVVILPVLSYSQVPGCTDPLANNFNSSATINDGSCLYNGVAYTPVVKVDPISDSLIESSGLQMAGGYLWSFNDGGNSPTLYRIDTLSNLILQRVVLSGANNIDWEDIAFDGEYFYIGDFGNNLNGARTDLKIYKFLLNDISDYINNPVVTLTPQQIAIISFTYSDQPQPTVVTTSNNTPFDCEAMIVDNGKIHLFTKNWIDKNTTHYIINSTDAGSYIAMPIETLATNYLVTAADKVAGQNIVTLLGYQNSGTGNHYLTILSDYTADSFFSGNKRKISLPDALTMGQSEGITFSNGKYGYISNEKFVRSIGPINITVNQKLRSFDISSFVADHFTTYKFNGNGKWSDTANWQYQMPPPLSLIPGNTIIINPVAGGVCDLDVPYMLLHGVKLTISAGKYFLAKKNLVVQ